MITLFSKNEEPIELIVSCYSDGSPMLKLPSEEVPYSQVVNYETILVQTKSFVEFMAAMFFVDTTMEQRTGPPRLVLPYLPGARQDRINVEGDILFTSNSVAQAINARQFKEVVILDPHSEQAILGIQRCTVFPWSEIVLQFVIESSGTYYDGIIAPDEGARNRAEQFSKRLSLPLFYGEKHRDVSTGELSGFSIDLPDYGHFLVVDDICDGGGTFIGLGDKIRTSSRSADLYVSHGIFAKGIEKLSSVYDNIYTTDSLGQQEDLYIEVVPITRVMVDN